VGIDNNIKQLKNDLKEKIGLPVNLNVVIATIESFGIREIDVQADYNVSSIEELAIILFNELIEGSSDLNSRITLDKENSNVAISGYLWAKSKLFVTKYNTGLLHQTPAFLQIFSIIFFGYSLWTSLEFNQLQSTSIVLGVIIGFILSGGFVQITGKQISFYWNNKDLINTKTTINSLIKNGLKSFLIVFVFLIGANCVLKFFPLSVLLIMCCYAFLIGYLLLVLAPLYPLNKRWVSSLAIILGTGIALLLKKGDFMHVYLTHWIGISIAILTTRLFLFFFLRKIKTPKITDNENLKSSQIIYANFNYFIYGVFFYMFIFLDRILAWSSTSNKELPFFIYYEPNYEIGMDLAVLTFFLLIGILEYSISAFSTFLDFKQKSTSFELLKKFNNDFKKTYWKNTLLLLVSGFFIIIFLYLLITSRWGYSAFFNEKLVNVSLNVFFIGSISYVFLIWGMLNTLYLFTLNISSEPLKAIIFGFTVNLIVGLILSRVFHFEYSVYGMLAGSITYMSITLKKVIKFLNQLDYHYYASY